MESPTTDREKIMPVLSFFQRPLGWLLLAFAFPACAFGQEAGLPDAYAIDFYGQIYLRNEFGGRPAHFVFDTGSPYTCADSTFIALGHFKFQEVCNARMGGAGKDRVRVPLVKDKVSNRFLTREHVPSMIPIIQLKPILGDYADGIVGLDYFGQKAFRIDYAHRRMRVYDSPDSIDLTGFTAVDIEFDDRRIYVPATVSVNDTLTIVGKMLVDLGSAGAFTLTSATARKYGLDSLITRKLRWYTAYGGIGGAGSSYDFRAKGARIGGFEWADVLMDYSLNESGALSARPYLGIIGNEIWSRFEVVFCPQGNKMYLRRNADYDKPYEMGTFGFGYVDRTKTLGYWVVTGLYEGGKAEKAGLRIDDHILLLNGRPVSELDIHWQYTPNKNLRYLDLLIERGGKTLNIGFDTEDPMRI
ncbi:hypothetical protein SAMN05216383_12614 [Prevotella sp. KH2C16]|nr:hypothetical protein SAMN05216383_12614 [Prevotella sp. KH2C16]